MQTEQAGQQGTVIDHRHGNAADLLTHAGFHTEGCIIGFIGCVSDIAQCCSQRRVPAADRRVRQRNAFVPFQQTVVLRFGHLGADLDTELGNEHMNGIAQTHLLRFHHILIVRSVPELDEVDVDIHLRLGQARILQIVLRKGAQHLIRRLILKSTSAIQYRDLLVRN